MDHFEKFIALTLHYLSIRTRSEKEIKDYLQKKKADAVVITTIIAKLKEQKFLNDQDFALWWIEQRTRVKPTAIRIIKLELMRKGVAKDVIEDVFANQKFIDDTEISSDVDRAKQLVERKIERYNGLPKQELYQKLGGFLARRGFNWDTIKQAIDEALEKEV